MSSLPESASPLGFAQLGVAPQLVESLAALEFHSPTPIQASAIPHLIAGQDVLGQARTGTGKTGAFGIPLVQGVDPDLREVQALVLAPTRELARQVTKALCSFAPSDGRLHIVTIYGGQPIGRQLSELRRGPQIVVGTPGRLIDCMQRGALRLDQVRMVVLDEADEMLRMGFVDDVELILSQAPEERQTALFSATMPGAIKRVADRYLDDPAHVKIDAETRTVEGLEQQVMYVHPRDRFEALVRTLELRGDGATLVFARTQVDCGELSDALNRRGFAAAALHGGLSQAQREQVVARLRDERVQLVVATDVAARGLDVDNITAVINFEPPDSPETYVHRIGRTARAGREGVALTLLTRQQRRIHRRIEQYTREQVSVVEPPSNEDLAAARRERFKAAVRATLESGTHEAYQRIVEELAEEEGVDPLAAAAAITRIAAAGRPLVAEEIQGRQPRSERPQPRPERAPRAHDDRPQRAQRGHDGPRRDHGGDWTKVFVSLGASAGLRPGDLVGALANEGGIPGRAIGQIDIKERVSFLEVAPNVATGEFFERVAELQIRGRRAIVRPADATKSERDARRPTRRAPAPSSGPVKKTHKRFDQGYEAPRRGSRPGRSRDTGTTGRHRRSAPKKRR